MRAKFGSDPTAGSKILSFKFISRPRLFKLASGAKVCAGAHFDLPSPGSRLGANFRVNNGNNARV